MVTYRATLDVTSDLVSWLENQIAWARTVFARGVSAWAGEARTVVARMTSSEGQGAGPGGGEEAGRLPSRRQAIRWDGCVRSEASDELGEAP